jgi:hypothetical protein
MTTHINPNTIFVFGSNLGGRHGKGAALTARLQHKAQWGVASGLTGNSYALPTCGFRFEPLALDEIQEHVGNFQRVANMNQENMIFQVTRIGCGLAYYQDHHIAPMFQSSPDNCYFDEKWAQWLGKEANYWGTF